MKRDGRWFVRPVATALDVIDSWLENADKRTIYTALGNGPGAVRTCALSLDLSRKAAARNPRPGARAPLPASGVMGDAYAANDQWTEAGAAYTSAISQAGRTPLIVDVDAFALQNAFEVNYGFEPTGVVALLNAGASAININILSGSQSVFTRDVSTGGNASHAAA